MTGFLALLIVILCVLTLFYPRKRDTPRSRRAVHLPLAVPILYLLYEITMPVRLGRDYCNKLRRGYAVTGPFARLALSSRPRTPPPSRPSP